MQHPFVHRFWTRPFWPHPSWAMRRLFLCFILVLPTVLLSTFPSYALDVKDVPNPRQEYGGWVTDMVDMLSPQAEQQLNQNIGQLEAENGTEIAVVTVPETHPSNTPKAFTTALFNEWGIGKADQDNGVLFLVSQGDRRTEIEVGSGIETLLPDAEVAQILATDVTPNFKQGDFETGILDGTQALIGVLENMPTHGELNQTLSSPQSQNSPTVVNAVKTIMVLFLATFGGLYGIATGLKRLMDENTPRMDLSPSGSTNLSTFPTGNVYCEQCSKPMRKVKLAEEIVPYLSRPQTVAQEIGSIQVQGWKCPRCAQSANHKNKKHHTQSSGTPAAGQPSSLNPPLHLLIQKFPSKASYCSICKELTVLTKKQPIPGNMKRRKIKKHCQCCGKTTVKESAIPSAPTRTKPTYSSPSRRSTRRSRSPWDRGYQNYGYGGSSGNSGSNSSDFGGGSSDGGGAGADW